MVLIRMVGEGQDELVVLISESENLNQMEGLVLWEQAEERDVL